jgi:signal transduction histidine kinase
VQNDGDRPHTRFMTAATARHATVAAAGACLAVSLLLNVVPAFDPTLGNRRFHVGVEVAAAMVLIFIGAVLVGRFRRDSSRRTLLMFAAVGVLAFDNLLSAVVTTTARDVTGGFATWATAGDGILGALLLAMAAHLPDQRIRRTRREIARILGPTAVMLSATLALAAIVGDALPAAFSELPTSTEDLLLSESPALIVAAGITALGYALAAAGFARLAEREDDEFLAWLGVGSVIAAVAFLDYALFPSQFTPLLASGDLMLLAAVAALAIGAVREIAHGEALTVHSAVVEERRRVARDLHDGVAQELAFISSQLQWFIREPTNHEPLNLVMAAVDRALDESRGAIASLNRPVDETLDVAVGHAALDIAARIGARIELDLEEGIEVPPHSREALLRIVRESMGNAVRHGGARTIDLQLRAEDGIRMRVADDGKGFDPDAPRSSSSYGLTSMRERTELVGGSFKISSAPGNGTTVEVVLP